MLSLEEFHARYDGEKPYYEYWDGEAVQKSAATFLHGRIQCLIAVLLDGIGYVSAIEVTLKLDPSYEPVPDIIALDGPVAGPYPTTPFDVVIEILSPQDSFSRVLRKCRLYERWGIRQIIVVDPAERLVWRFREWRSSRDGCHRAARRRCHTRTSPLGRSRSSLSIRALHRHQRFCPTPEPFPQHPRSRKQRLHLSIAQQPDVA